MATNLDEKLQKLSEHYSIGVAEMDVRRTRKNGWNDVIDAYMSKLPANWPHQAKVTDPRIRTAILEKTARLLNSKLQGRLVPREGGDVIKARVNNCLLDFQWDFASEGGSMQEKVAFTDQIARLFGGAFVLVYWDNSKDSNEIKLIDPRDIFFDGSATHIRNAKWVQVREWTTWDKVEDRGYNVNKWKRMAKAGDITADKQSTAYESIIKANKGIENRTGEYDDPKNPVVEVVTEWTKDTCVLWLPKYDLIVYEGDNPYEHKKIPLAQLRYYPLGDDIYGEPEVESVLGLSRAINFFLSGTIDELSMAIRPPLKLIKGQYRSETIEYGPGAQWIVNSIDAATQMPMGRGAIEAFNTIYPALIGAFDSAMGDRSQGIRTEGGSKFGDPTATQVRSDDKQQNSRDQYNQLYLSEFLKDIMLMWLANNKQYLFDDENKKTHIIKIIGKDNIKYLQQMLMDDKDIPDYAMRQITDTITQNPGAISPEMIDNIMEDVAIPTNPVIENPEAKNPEDYKIRPKLKVMHQGEEAELSMTPEDLEGVYDYIPDVKSMGIGASQALADARDKALTMILNPNILNILTQQGNQINIKELLVSVLEDAGYRDAESIFENVNNQTIQGTGGLNPAGAGSINAGTPPNGAMPNGGLQAGASTIPFGPRTGGLPESTGLQGQAPAPTGFTA